MPMALAWASLVWCCASCAVFDELLSTELPTQGRTVGSGSTQVVPIVGCSLMFHHMSCVLAAGTTSQLLPPGQEGCGVSHGLYLRSDSEEPRSEHSTSGVTLERSDPRREFFSTRRWGIGLQHGVGGGKNTIVYDAVPRCSSGAA